MLTNKQFLKKLNSARATYYPFDFHFHSLASFDVVEGIAKTESVKYEEGVVAATVIDKYYEALVEQKKKICDKTGMMEGNQWSIMAITDHNVFKFASELSTYAWEPSRRKENQFVIMPGVELDVETTLDGNQIEIHILLIFKPDAKYHEIYHRISSCNGEQDWTYGEKLVCSNLEDFIHKLRNDVNNPALCIAAHVASSKGIRAESKDAILTATEVSLARIQQQLDGDINAKEREELNDEMTLLEEKMRTEVVTLEVLKFIGKCGFDGLQVRGRRDEPHYQYLHRFKRDKGRSIPLSSSDAHEIDGLFIVDDGGDTHTPFIKIETSKFNDDAIALFTEVKDKAIRYGETRLSYGYGSRVSEWIDGLLIERDSGDSSSFWSFEDGKDHLIIPFSQNLNCMIGGRGSGKSAVIEMLEFTNASDQFKSQNKNEDWYKRATATLAGCKVTICWKLIKEDSLKRKALFRSFYFDKNGRHDIGSYANVEGDEVLDCDIPSWKLPRSKILRIHDIEKEAEADNILTLFDKLSGVEQESINTRITDKLKELADNREAIVGIATQINDLCADGMPIREYARRKKKYDDVNTEEIGLLYDKIDALGSEQKEIQTYENEWSEIEEKADLQSLTNNIEDYFDSINEALNDGEDELKIKELKDLINEKLFNSEGVNKSFADEIQDLLSSLSSKFIDLNTFIREFKESLTSKISTEKSVLIDKGLPEGSNDRQVKKDQYDASVKSLEKYDELLEQYQEEVENRKALLTSLKSTVDLRSSKREDVSKKMTSELKNSLNEKILKIEMDAQKQMNKDQFKNWLMKDFDWGGRRNVEFKVNKLINDRGLDSQVLKKELSEESINKPSLLKTDALTSADGKIESSESKQHLYNNRVWYLNEAEVVVDETYSKEFVQSLPERIRNGLLMFMGDQNDLNIDQVLKLDEVINADIPIIKLNDRPSETATMKEIDKLSPGQRCSAILPILLLHGKEPLVIDQPEDNLDNRLIRQVVVNILNTIKLRRQVVIATHNPNLPVLGDSENVIALKAISDDSSTIAARGTIDNEDVINNISKIMEGGREALQYRYSIYQEFWQGDCATE